MYSRKFSGGVDLPAGYGGVALRANAKNEETEELEGMAEARERSSIPPSANERQGGRKEEADAKHRRFQEERQEEVSREAFSRAAHKDSFSEEYGGTFRAEEDRRPKYPLYGGYAPPYDLPPREREERKRDERSEKTGGLLSSLFSLSGKSFSMEDIVLAGLILLLLGEKDGQGKSDNELLLILGLLLMGGKN